ncbi:YdiY family protein [Aquirhabdus sp.]|uniref:DUF481 domain-containing protein n=1 Tax=Aquirhabdus sp. TaxID=2824160 RepID=UPI00396C65AE
MTFPIKKLTAVMLGLSLSVVSYAAEDAIKVSKDKDYNLDADLSYLLNNSNNTDGTSSNKQSIAGHVTFKRMQGDWGQEFKAEAIGSSDNQSTDNIERYLASGKLMHSEGSYYEFGKLQWEKDLSSAFDYQTYLTGGIGSELYRDDVQFLTGEIGAGVRYSVERQPPKDDKTEAIGTLAAHYERTLTKTVNFAQDLGYDYGASSNTFRSRSALSMMMTDKLSGLLSFDYKKISSNEGDSNSSLTAFGLKYSY